MDTHQNFMGASGYENWDPSAHFQQKKLTFGLLTAEIGARRSQKTPILGLFQGSQTGPKSTQNRGFLRCPSPYLSRQQAKCQDFLLKMCARVPIFTRKNPRKVLVRIEQNI